MKKPTKYYSSMQENRIAEYLGWKVVSGSGARPFNPGDIISDHFLGECKTHTEKNDKITIKADVLVKIKLESESIFRLPVLFIDNGTQSIDNTWCALSHETPLPDFDYYVIDTIKHNNLFKMSKTRITFNHYETSKVFHLYKKGLAYLKCADIGFVLTQLNTFKTMIDSR